MNRKILLLALGMASPLGAFASNNEETCDGPQCSERYINRTVRPSRPDFSPPYDDDRANPPRDTLRFPDFNPAWGLTRKIYQKAAA